MSVLIRGMEMPTSCSTCFIAWCIGRANNPQVMVQRGADCPLVPVPPHGRLIDADALLFNIPAPIEDEYKYVRRIIEDAPTIIPASGGNEDE